MKASPEAVAAVQKALALHRVNWHLESSRWYCTCGEDFGAGTEGYAAAQAHTPQVLADASAALIASQALREAASDAALRLSGHSGVSVRGLRDRAAQIEVAS